MITPVNGARYLNQSVDKEKQAQLRRCVLQNGGCFLRPPGERTGGRAARPSLTAPFGVLASTPALGRSEVKDLNTEINDIQGRLAQLGSQEKVERGQLAKIADEMERLKQLGTERARKAARLQSRVDMRPQFVKQIAAVEAAIARLAGERDARRRACAKEVLAQRALVVQLAPMLGALTGTALRLYQAGFATRALEEKTREVSERLRAETERLNTLKTEADVLKGRARELLDRAKQVTGADVISEALKAAFDEFPNELDALAQRIHDEKARLECHARVDPRVVEEYHRREQEIAELAGSVRPASRGEREKDGCQPLLFLSG